MDKICYCGVIEKGFSPTKLGMIFQFYQQFKSSQLDFGEEEKLLKVTKRLDILQNELDITKAYTRCVPRLLTPDQNFKKYISYWVKQPACSLITLKN